MNTSCNHDSEKEVVITKNIKIIFKIYNKTKLMIRSTYKELNFDNFSPVLILVMRELSKHKLTGYSKHQMAVEIMSLLLVELGVPPVISHYSAEGISRVIEYIYVNGFHKYKRPHKLRFWK